MEERVQWIGICNIPINRANVIWNEHLQIVQIWKSNLCGFYTYSKIFQFEKPKSWSRSEIPNRFAYAHTFTQKLYTHKINTLTLIQMMDGAHDRKLIKLDCLCVFFDDLNLCTVVENFPSQALNTSIRIAGGEIKTKCDTTGLLTKVQ